jgi:signal transduction histidine kinase
MKRKGLPVRPWFIVRLMFVPVLALLLLVGTNFVLSGTIPLTDIVIFPMLRSQYQAALFGLVVVGSPLLLLSAGAWLKNLYRAWDGLSWTLFIKPVMALPVLLLPTVLLLAIAGSVFSTFMLVDPISVRSRVASEEQIFYLVKLNQSARYDVRVDDVHVLYRCEETGVLCRKAAVYAAAPNQTGSLFVEGDRLRIGFADPRSSSPTAQDIYFYPLE